MNNQNQIPSPPEPPKDRVVHDHNTGGLLAIAVFCLFLIVVLLSAMHITKELTGKVFGLF